MLALGLGLAMPAGCSDDEDRRDQNYGTDLGANYQLPDGNLDRMPETAPADEADALATDAAVPESPPGDAAEEETSPDAAPFQDTGVAADTGTGG